MWGLIEHVMIWSMHDLTTDIKNFFQTNLEVWKDKIFQFSALILLELSVVLGIFAHQGPPIRSFCKVIFQTCKLH